MADVHIVGAGPSGCIAAISAQRANHRAVVSEDHPVAGIPENCSGLFSKDGLDSLRGFIDYRKFVIRPIRGADIHVGRTTLSVRRDGPVGYVCDRAAMDYTLAANAEAEGARVRYNDRVKGSFLADNIIGADGPLSSVARHFRFPRIGTYATTLQSLVDYHAEEPDIVEVFLSNSMFPGFFGWIIPHDEDTAEFGVGVELPKRAHEAWKAILRMRGVEGAPQPKGAVIPLALRPKTSLRTGRRRVLLAGDAAGQVKATTGGGVIFGGNCAAIAGKNAEDPSAYEREWRGRFWADLALHRAVRAYLSGKSDEGLSVLGRRLKKLNFDGYLSDHGHMDRPTRMIRPELLAHVLKNII